MTVAQADRQASARTIASSATTHDGDMRAMFEAEATIPAGSTYNEAFILWLQERTGSASTNINSLMAAFAEELGAYNWSSVGAFDAAGIIHSGLVHEWRFDDGSGATVTDYAGGLDGTANGSPPWVTGGLDVDNDDYVTTAAATFPSPDFHVDVVARFTGGEDPPFVVLFGAAQIDFGGGDEADAPFSMFTTGGALFVRVGDGADFQQTSGSAAGVFDDAWHHVAIDYDGNAITVLVDNVALISAQALGQTPNVHSAINIFGGHHIPQNFSFDGIYGYITVYNRTLSAEENTAQNVALVEIMAARGITLP
jgi:hypothetical protein